MAFHRVNAAEKAAVVEKTNAIEADFAVDAASAVVTDASGARYRIPKASAAFDRFTPGSLRGVRECVSERYLANFCGLFYEIPRTDTKTTPYFRQMKPVAAHGFAIADFCTWRGLLVLAGCRADAKRDGHVVGAPGGGPALWFGQIDDLWKPYSEFEVKPGATLVHEFPAGFSAHWVRVAASADCTATVQLEYR